ncbi:MULTISPECIES: hypothetical protein [Rhodococcus]|jgi:hypothetical protein|uniref:Uncharacterized protein n=1 Tax=Rhodococcus qingshengii TaxID=334542 RepID=A0AAW6LPX1_RHOSG|nr:MULTISPECIES: hypothetical protein [Rhodococcus]MDE8647521.1 hypothetical protein [Rhodococcus qingshengii]
MAQIRPRITGRKSTGEKPSKFRDASGATVQIDPVAAKTLASSVVSSPVKRVSRLTGDVSVPELRTQIGYDGLRAAAVAAGRKEPSMRTLQRWVQRNHIPHAAVEEGAQRRASVERLGGVQVVAAMLQRSPSSVYRWQSGKTNRLRGPAGVEMANAKTLDAMREAKAFNPDGTLRRAEVTVTATVEVRYNGQEGYEHRDRKLFRFAEDTTPMSPTDLWELGHALARGAFGDAVGVIERFASTAYPDNQASGGLSQYDDGNGFHFEEVHDIDIVWLR